MEILYKQGDCEIARLTAGREQEALLMLFAEVAREEGWQPGEQLRAYAKSSIYLAAFVQGELAGGVQLVLGSSTASFPCLSVWPELALLGRADIADVAVFAFRQSYRGKFNLFWQLLVEVWRFSRQQGITVLYMEVTPHIYRIYRRLGWPVEIVGPLRSHWGEACYPCRVGVTALEQAFTAKGRHSNLFSSLLEQAYRNCPANPAQQASEQDVAKERA